ncbi:MAG: acyl-CoA synthetase [Microbacterium sp.]|uniref:AMP-binding protein n=1 Tax=uncultured Microbacterium sp. TaxID=191216 RepID=UPI000C923B20|nr:AMP-binding protein [uncultured Microbacterium sp.]MAL05575.1 acyl-CoA synthetase [Microbacterium sp.]
MPHLAEPATITSPIPLSPAANDEPLTPLRFLQRAAEVFPDKDAIVYGARRYSYRRFAREAEQLARVLQARIEPGDRIAYLVPNTPEMLIGHFAVPLAGGVLVAINTRLSRAEIDYILLHSGARVLIADAEILASIGDPLASVGTLEEVVEVQDPEFGHPGGHVASGQVSYEEFLGRAADLDEPVSWHVRDERAPISINYTSGTTGKPKGVVYTHRGAYLNALGEVFHQQLTSASVYLWTLPMFHCNGWCTPWAVTAAGATHVGLRAVRADRIWELIDGASVTHLCGAPTVCTTIAASADAHLVERPLRITTAGAPPSPTIIETLEDLGITVVHVYGLTEVYGPFTVCEYQTAWDGLDRGERAKRLARQGVGMVQAESARVVDEQGQDVPADGTTIGEIVLRGNNVMLEYFRDSRATKEAFRGGWFHTGDLGVMHPDRYIELKDRAKDIVISGGENISTVEVEQAVVSHDAVLEVAVIGRPDARWGERPVAFVVLREGHAAGADELRVHTRGLLAAFKVPDEFHFVAELPHTATGKVRKFDLRAAAVNA